MRILALNDGLGCGWVRMIQPLRQMEKHGHEVRFARTQDIECIEGLRNAGDYDVVVGQRFTGYEGMSMWRKARKPHNRLVYETDDDLFSIEMDNFAAYASFNQPVVQEAIEGYLATADLVTVTTETLAQVQRDKGVENVAVLPNCVPEYVLELPRVKHDKPRVGWVGGASHGADVHECLTPVRRFMKKNPEWELFLGGTDFRPTFALQNLDQMVHAPWRQINDDERAYYEFIDFDIGIVPLRDTKFARSKSALKALEYNARGIPVVASDVQPYSDYIQHGYNGFLCKTEQDWSKYLRLLAEDDDLRLEMGNKGRFEAGKHTIENNWSLWEQAYEGMGVK